MKLQDCIDDEVYYWESSKFKYINWYKKSNNNSGLNIKCYISTDSARFETSYARNTNPQNIRVATPEEKHWLLCCVEADKYVNFQEALLSFIPIKESNSEYIKQLEIIYKKLLNL